MILLFKRGKIHPHSYKIYLLTKSCIYKKTMSEIFATCPSSNWDYFLFQKSIFVQNSLVGSLPLWICRNLLIYILLPVWNEEQVTTAKYFGIMYIHSLVQNYLEQKEEILFSQILPNTLHQSPAEYDNLHLPSLLEGKVRTPSFSAGCRGFVTSLCSQGTRELGNQGTRMHVPSAECRGRKGNQCIGGRRGFLETQCLIRICGNSRGKTKLE